MHVFIGMEYLHHTLNPPIMHRDIAARNCLYGNEKVKISDFGLAKTGTFFQVTQMTKAPIRWLAPETLKDIIYTPKTDVFSYGVLCWEIFTDAKTEPYAGMTAAEFVPKVKEGYRLDFPEFTPPDFSQLVKTKIWTDNPAERYSMAEVAHGLEKITNLQRPAYSGSDNVHQPKQPHLGSDNQPHGGDKLQHHQDKKKSGRHKVRKSNDNESLSDESSHAVHKTQSRRQKNKKPGRKTKKIG
uniref:Protein kinase domain-containing protein n=1 Tax=Panagrolaimus davidi TaxID=227884 RepID=A0A914Q968_9BILA